MSTSYPNNIWDGDSANRDSDNNPRKSPDYRDWLRMIEEMAATQKALDIKKIDLINLTTRIDAFGWI